MRETPFETRQTPILDPLPVRLSQRHFFSTREYELGLNAVTLIESNIFASNTYKIPFEAIANEPVEKNYSSKLAFLATTVFLALSLVSAINIYYEGGTINQDQIDPLVWGILAIFFAFCLFLTRKQYIIFGALRFQWYWTKSKILRFMEKVKTQKANYFKEHYINQLITAGSIHDIAKLFWLKENGILDDDQFIKIKTNIVKNIEIGNGEPPSVN